MVSLWRSGRKAVRILAPQHWHVGDAGRKLRSREHIPTTDSLENSMIPCWRNHSWNCCQTHYRIGEKYVRVIGGILNHTRNGISTVSECSPYTLTVTSMSCSWITVRGVSMSPSVVQKYCISLYEGYSAERGILTKKLHNEKSTIEVAASQCEIIRVVGKVFIECLYSCKSESNMWLWLTATHSFTVYVWSNSPLHMFGEGEMIMCKREGRSWNRNSAAKHRVHFLLLTLLPYMFDPTHPYMCMGLEGEMIMCKWESKSIRNFALRSIVIN